ncbi:transcription termination factor 1, mitochondrial [Tachyglossus aculeatus]|uniref:transcription termination factor 1, mitochondrial n=1 Tax=Tachyglossus aculeatus TaxID=9261 RepID=UPI0018F282ED|nr:transcription termination factor 1, mitochondrial [Tachyglossus aculeatus]
MAKVVFSSLHPRVWARVRGLASPLPKHGAARRPLSGEAESVGREPPGGEPLAENGKSLSNLSITGMDLSQVQRNRRWPTRLRQSAINEKGLKQFLMARGASQEVVANIITRYPRAIVHSPQVLQRRWELWRGIITSDLEVVSILERCPESFFRNNSNTNLEQNIAFLSSLGLTPTCLSRLLTKVPRAFSNSLELNQQMVEYLQGVCQSQGGQSPQGFVLRVLSKNAFILNHSIKRVETNIDFLKGTFHLGGKDLLAVLGGPGSKILDMSNDCIKRNFWNIEAKLAGLGCCQEEVRAFVRSYLPMLFLSRATFNDKIDCLLQERIAISQIKACPNVLSASVSTLRSRARELVDAGCHRGNLNILFLSWSKNRFDAKMRNLLKESAGTRMRGRHPTTSP